MNQTSKLIEICYLAQTFCQGHKTKLTDNEMKVLFFVEQYSNVSPQILISKLGLAKSKLALLTKNLIQKQLICSHPSLSDRRAITFSTTAQGKEVVKTYIATLSKLVRPEEMSENLIVGIDQVCSFLNKKV